MEGQENNTQEAGTQAKTAQTYYRGRFAQSTGGNDDGSTMAEGKAAALIGNVDRVERRHEQFLGSGWSFVESESGNFWLHKTGLKLAASSTWEKRD